MYKVSDRDGLYVAVLISGTISFRYDYRINGRRETLVIGQYGRDGITLAEAGDELIAAKAAEQASRRLRRSVTVSKDPRRRNIYGTYRRLHETCGPGRQHAGYEAISNRRDILPVLGNKMMSEITTYGA